MIVVTDDAARAACVVWHQLLLGETVKPEDIRPDALAAMRSALEAGLALLEDAGEPVQVKQHPTRTELSSRLDNVARSLRGAGRLASAEAVDSIRAVIDGPAPLDRPGVPLDTADDHARHTTSYNAGFEAGKTAAAAAARHATTNQVRRAAGMPEVRAAQTGRDGVSMPWPDPSLAEVLAAVNRVGAMVEQTPGTAADAREAVRRTGALTTRIERLIDHQIESGQRIVAIIGPVMGETPDDTVAGMIDAANVEQRKAAARHEQMLLDLVGMLTGGHKGSFGRRLADLEDATTPVDPADIRPAARPHAFQSAGAPPGYCGVEGCCRPMGDLAHDLPVGC